MTRRNDTFEPPAIARAGVQPGTRVFDVSQDRVLAKPALPAVWLAVAVCAISLLHYGTSVHLIWLHEVLKRLYYVPIVMAAVTYGTKGGVATAMFASLLYLPHVIRDGQGGVGVSAERYAELVLFNVVAVLTGWLVSRLRAERNRYRDAAADLREAYRQLQERADERLRVDRLVTVGRIASGIAHEVRSPLGGLLGCIEILESEFPRTHPKREFFAIAKKEVSRLNRVVGEFLDFAEPAPPSSQGIDLYDVVRSTSHLAGPSLNVRAVTIHLHAPTAPRLATVDAEQVQRAVLNVILGATLELRDTRVDVRVCEPGESPAIVIRIPHAEMSVPAGDVFDPFPPSGRGHGLTLATARRLIENQQGTLRAERLAGAMEFVIELPGASQPAAEVTIGLHGDAA